MQIFLLLLTSSIFITSSSFADDSVIVSLDSLKSAAKVYPDSKKAFLEFETTIAQEKKIQGEFGPKINLLAGIGPNKKTSGNALSSTQSDQINTSTFLGTIELKWPLFQFNRSNDLKKANDFYKDIKNIEYQKKISETFLKAKEYYFGHQYAQTLLDFTKEVQSDLQNALEKIERGKNPDNDNVLKIKIFKNIVESKRMEIESAVKKTQLGLADILQVHDSSKIKLDDVWLSFDADSFITETLLNERFQIDNYENKLAKNALLLREKLFQSEEKSRLPVFGLFSKYEFVSTPGSTKQTSKFSYDPYHKNDFSIGVGIIYEFDFGSKAFDILKSNQEYKIAMLDYEHAQKGLPLLFKKKFLDYEESFLKAKSLQGAYKNSKKLITRFQAEAAFGVQNDKTFVKDFIEAYTLRATLFKDFQEAVYQTKLKEAELEHFIGTFVN